MPECTMNYMYVMIMTAGLFYWTVQISVFVCPRAGPSYVCYMVTVGGPGCRAVTVVITASRAFG